MPTAAPPRTLRALMAGSGVYAFADLSKRSGVDRGRITVLSQGWRGTPSVRRAIAKALGCTPADVAAAARAAHDEVKP